MPEPRMHSSHTFLLTVVFAHRSRCKPTLSIMLSPTKCIHYLIMIHYLTKLGERASRRRSHRTAQELQNLRLLLCLASTLEDNSRYLSQIIRLRYMHAISDVISSLVFCLDKKKYTASQRSQSHQPVTLYRRLQLSLGRQAGSKFGSASRTGYLTYTFL